jgi:sugar lactone lactonase YvrE/murein DD-endopeptidase MepM/ murein hydrolase activator NlpD
VLAIAAVAGLVLWTRTGPPRPRALDVAWQASVLTIAGDGVAATRDGDVRSARFADPFGVALSPDGSIYVADAGDSPRIRRISSDGVVSTLAGGERGFADGIGAAARFNAPSGLAIDSGGAIYVADTGNNAIRRIAPDSTVTTIAGGGSSGYRDGPGAQAQFNGPVGVAADAAGRVLIADTYNDRIRAIGQDGTVTTIAGGAITGMADGAAADAQFNTPCGIAVDGTGNVLVADTGNSAVRSISPTGIVTTVSSPIVDGLRRPVGIALGPRGDIYVADDIGRIVELTAAGAARTLAGSRAGFKDGAGDEARFRRLGGIAIAAPGRLIVVDGGNALVRMVGAPSQLDWRLPPSPRINPHFDFDRFASEPLLWPVEPLDGPHEIAGTLGEARGGQGGERFHAGIDVRIEEGTPVIAVRDGAVAAPMAAADFGTLVESLRIGPLAYVHIRVGRERGGPLFDTSRFAGAYNAAGKLAGIRVKRGARFDTGEEIGTVNPFNHVHLNVGWPGEEFNPLLMRLAHFEDSVPPTIERGGVRLYDEAGQPFKQRVKGRLLVHGRVQTVVDAWDQVDGNASRRRLGLYRLGYQVLLADGTPAPGFENAHDTIVFNRLDLSPDAPRIVYAPGSGIPFYGQRRTKFLYAVTNTFHDGVAASGVWDTTTLTPGNYTLRIRAADVRGNEAVANRDLPVTIEPQ